VSDALDFGMETRMAIEVMVVFYLSQGFMEAPNWEDLSDDQRKGFRGIVKRLDWLAEQAKEQGK
jgi:hypothetical protein